ncbi:hypothetical protein ACOQFL_00275 [Actinopolyspora sp. H202]|uniref:hypothetical protein n=1 Tax=Actinopolyspora sp. H202 TaxID=1500456 RepID=UPI003EE59FFF
MHEEHTGSRAEGEYERLAGELRSLLPALAARAEEFLLSLSRGEHASRPTGGESAGGDSPVGESVAGESARGTTGCPCCTLTAVLREAHAKRPADGLYDCLLALLSSLREAFTAPNGETGTTDAVHRDGTGEPPEQRADEPRVHPITVNRVRGDVLGGNPGRARNSAG